jgi:DNA replication protein DnaC
MTSQLPTKTRHAHLADQTLAAAILDRILHNAHRLVLKGPSRRKLDKETEAE